MVRYLITFEGQVQGVGFRSYSHLNANKYHLTGWAKNLSNGMVEVQIQGQQDDVDKYIQTMILGNMFIKVENYSMKKIPIVEKESTYFTKY